MDRPTPRGGADGLGHLGDGLGGAGFLAVSGVALDHALLGGLVQLGSVGGDGGEGGGLVATGDGGLDLFAVGKELALDGAVAQVGLGGGLHTLGGALDVRHVMVLAFS